MIDITDGRADDAPALAELWRAAWQLTYPEIDFAARLPFIHGQFGEAAEGRYAFRVAWHASVPQGFTLVEGETSLLEQIVVAPEAWGTGAADALLDDVLKRHGPTLWLVVNQFNARAITFYQRKGFVIVAEGANAAGRPTYTMRLAAKTPLTP
ncbi:MAG: hypothetical protein FD175_1878 [Beijerinckiaceae bacterium]|nr:MAG: hypothetical protein FD175_1878 [Beijerinckiaceae bacterium]